MSKTVEPLFVRPADAAKMIGFSKAKLFEMLRDGEIRRIKKGRSTLIEVAELQRWAQGAERSKDHEPEGLSLAPSVAQNDEEVSFATLAAAMLEELRGIRGELQALREELHGLRAEQRRELLTIQEAAQRLNTDRTQLGKLVASGLVRSVPHKQRRRIPLEEVKRLAAEGLPEMPRRGRPRKVSAQVSDEILAIPLPTSTKRRNER